MVMVFCFIFYLVSFRFSYSIFFFRFYDWDGWRVFMVGGFLVDRFLGFCFGIL